MNVVGEHFPYFCAATAMHAICLIASLALLPTLSASISVGRPVTVQSSLQGLCSCPGELSAEVSQDCQDELCGYWFTYLAAPGYSLGCDRVRSPMGSIDCLWTHTGGCGNVYSFEISCLDEEGQFTTIETGQREPTAWCGFSQGVSHACPAGGVLAVVTLTCEDCP